MAMPFPDGSFSAVLSFTMLHHVPSVTLQDQLLSQRRGACCVREAYSRGRTLRWALFCSWPKSATP
jgi:hypothetical protein